MEIQSGLEEYQVLQRNSQNVAIIKCEGTCSVDAGTVLVAITNNKGIPAGPMWHPVGSVSDGTWTVPGLPIPTGGEYTVRFRIVHGGKVLEECCVNHILVGDLWILAGQSNMEGAGILEKAEDPVDVVHSFGMNDKWCLAEEPLHRLWESVDRFHNSVGHCPSDRGVSPGLAFGKELAKRTGVPVGLIPCAHGGTTMEQWDPALKDRGGDSLYGAMLRRFHAVGGKVAGVLWYQGESETNTDETLRAFPSRFSDFVKSVRTDFQDDTLPFIYVQIGRVIIDEANAYLCWNGIQEGQRLCEEKIPYSAMVASVDLPLDDLIHISADGQNRLGRRLAKAVCSKVFGHPLTTGPRLQRVEVQLPHRTAVNLYFSNVNGGLVSAGRPNGFTLLSQDGKVLPIIYHVEIDRYNPACVILRLTTPLPGGASVMYGMGKDPYCNIVDEEDMAVPVFGPVPCDA
jgi:sialate O-acetylesterase